MDDKIVKMTSRERVSLSLNHKCGDRVPVFASFTPEIEKKLKSVFGEHGDVGILAGNDMIKISSGLENSFYMSDEDEYTCPYGIKWKNVKNETGHYTEIINHPLKSEKMAIDKLNLPIAADDYKVIEKTKNAIQKYKDEYWIIGSCQCSIFEAGWYLRGLETLLMDMLTDEEYCNKLFDKVMQYPYEMSHIFLREGVDMVWFGDDVATQKGMMISPDVWRKYLKPRYKQIFDSLKNENPDIKICYHSCGNIEAIIPDLIEIGLDVINPIQPLAIDPRTVKVKYGEKLSLFGGFDVQFIFPNGSIDEIRNETKRLIEICGNNGGYIISPAHHLQSDTPIENILAFYDAVHECGA